ncbi:hypothetical protein AB4Z45_17615 [Paenibacillus sp. MCAF9]|uniref:DUF6843 domain-containing protein n=1 Tax=Paenibacillus sp. MCAF9 TaxID=3233046 RepID=UPI003F980182
MKQKLFYVLVAIASYFAGVLAYLGYLALVYDQSLGSDASKLIGWTLPSYLFLILPFYTLMFRWRKSAIFLRTALLIVLSIIAAASVTVMMGLGIWGIQNLFSPEFGLFILLFASSAIVFSVGSLVAIKEKGYVIFLLASLVIIYLPINMLVSEVEKSRPVIHHIPQSFHGTVVIHFGDSSSPPISKKKGYEVINISENGIYKTSSPRPVRGIRHVLVDELGNEVKKISISGETMKYGSDPGVTISEYTVP